MSQLGLKALVYEKEGLDSSPRVIVAGGDDFIDSVFGKCDYFRHFADPPDNLYPAPRFRPF
jgi:hypothetical protein